MLKKPPGIEDIFPDKINLWNHIKKSAISTFELYNYKEIVIPIMEFTDVFSRGLGDETDIVSKEMFTFEDRGKRSLTLRPEGTASVVRAYVENGEYNRLSSAKFFYIGQMFRAEKPQRGRLRQFNQFGAEFFGSDNPYYDYEIISMVNKILQTIGIKEYKLLINSIGCKKCRKSYIEELKKYYENKKENLCDDCKRRLDENTLRLLDCKVNSCNELKKNAPKITDFLCEDCSNHHTKVKEYLQDENIPFTEDPLLVRGLDYYTRTTFEFVTTEIAGQNAIAAGGRYDGLVEQFEGKATPAVGFAAGMERIMLLCEDVANSIKQDSIDAYIIHTGGDALSVAIETVALLRQNGFSADMDPAGTGFKSQFKKADRANAKSAVIIGENELNNKTYTVKDLKLGEQTDIPMNTIVDYLKKKKTENKK